MGWVLFIGLGLMFFLLVRRQDTTYAQVSLTEFQRMLQANEIASLSIGDDGGWGTVSTTGIQMANGGLTTSFRAGAPNGASGNWGFIEWVLAHRGSATVYIDSQPNILMQIVLPLIPWLLIFGFIWFFVFRQLRKGQAMRQPIPVYQVPAPQSSEGLL
jgi:ATP-dependent Zn protease